MHDSISAELAGTPAAAVITDRFTSIVKLMASARGIPDYPYAVISHPVSLDDQRSLRAKADEALDQCVKLLTTAQDDQAS